MNPLSDPILDYTTYNLPNYREPAHPSSIMTTPGHDKPPNTGGDEDGAMSRDVMEFQTKLRAQPGDELTEAQPNK